MPETEETGSDTDAEDSEEGETEPLAKRIDYGRVASVATTFLVVAAAVPFVIYAFPALVGAQNSFVVLSGSMEPAMSPGDMIVIEDVEAQEIERGDVITYRKDGSERPTTHRVIEVRQENGQPVFKTKGDANENSDSGVVRPSEVQGRVPTVAGTLFVIPYVGHVIVFAGTQLGFTLLFAMPFVLFVGNEIGQLVLATRSSSGTKADTPAEGSGEGAADAAPEESDGTDDPADRDLPDGVEPAIVPLDDASEDGSATAASEEAADEEEDDADEDAAVTLTRGELSLGLFVLGGFFAYSLWVAYATVTVWAVTVAGATATAFLMLGSLYVFGGDSDAATDDEAPDETVESDEASTDEDVSEPEPEAVEELPALDELFGGGDLDASSDAWEPTVGAPAAGYDELPGLADLFDDETSTADRVVFDDLTVSEGSAESAEWSTSDGWVRADDLLGSEGWSDSDEWTGTEVEPREQIVFGAGDADDDLGGDRR